MKCRIIENYLKENDCVENGVPTEIQKHLDICKYCQNYYQFASVLSLQKGLLEKAPEDILTYVEKKINEIKNYAGIERKHFTLPSLFPSLLKPAIAFISVFFVATGVYLYMTNKSIGHVENLSTRFKIAKFENIKPGDMLYASDSTTVKIRLNSKSTFNIHRNTVVKVASTRKIVLSRGEISLVSGDKEILIETPDGVLFAKNANTKITVLTWEDNGLLKTKTTSVVFSGELTIKSPPNEIIRQGEKVVLVENSRITFRKQLTVAESESEKVKPVKQKLFAAVESLCDCIHVVNYDPDEKKYHLLLFGKEVNENKFKVRVFWKEKGVDEMVSAPSIKNNKYYPYPLLLRRFDAYS